MAIIYTYPVATPVLDDLLLISDSNDGKKTKNITITSLKSLINTQYTLTSDQNGADVDVKLNDNAGSVVSTVKLVKGSNITLSNSGSNITISSTGGGGGGGSVDSVTTTNGTFINLTPNSAATGAVTVTADLSATGTTDSTTFLRGDNTWNVPPDTIYSLPTATSSILGGIKLFSDTDQAVAANTVSAIASRTYGLQLNSSDQAVVNVPWLNTTYSDFVGATSTTDGSNGLVPQPEAGDYQNFLRGDGNWAAVSGGSVTSVSTNGGLDPGSPLSAALSLSISTPTTTPNLVFQWEGASTQYVSGEGALVTFPTVDNISSFTATQVGGSNTDPNLTINDGTSFNLQIKGSGGTSVTRDSGGGFITIASGGVTSFTNANGTFISAATVNTAATGSVTIGSIDLSATGTPSSSSFLRGDNTWAVPPSGGTSNLSLLKTGVFETTLTNTASYSRFLMGNSTTFQQVNFNPASTTGANNDVIVALQRPTTATNYLRIKTQLSIAANSASAAKVHFAWHHVNGSTTNPTYGWQTVGLDDDVTNDFCVINFTTDILVSDLLKLDGDNAAAGNAIYLWLKATASNTDEEIAIGRYWPSTMSSSSNYSAGPLIVEVYELTAGVRSVNVTSPE